VTQKAWIIKDLLKVTTEYLKAKEIENPRLHAETLLAHQLEISRINLYLSYDKPLNDNEVSGYRSLIKRSVNNEPLQYITGIQEFWSMDFMVDPRVLIPRPETELLVELVIKKQDKDRRESNRPLILDMCTGSGAVAVALAKELEYASVWATDISQGALDVAKINALKHKVEDRIKFIHGDLFEPLKDREEKFDFIVTNPPYVTQEEYDTLAPCVRDYEPRQALDGHEKGVFYIKRIISGAADYLKPNGWLLIEMDPMQTEIALELIEKTGVFTDQTRIKDYCGRYRVVVVQR
jgi:release factor glutamine methyltransferase